MKHPFTWLAILALALSPLVAGTTDAEKAAWTARLKQDYPLGTCVVSGDPLVAGEMGPPIDYLYEEQGKDPRLVRFCCKGCIRTFKKNPAKYLKMIDEAALKAKGGGSASHGCCEPSAQQDGHPH